MGEQRGENCALSLKFFRVTEQKGRVAAYIGARTLPRDFGRSRNCAVINQVPLARYFLFVGTLLLAMLFIADHYLDKSSSPTFREAEVDKSIIRIRSAHKWPEKIIFDTSLPTFGPPSPVFATPVVSKPREAFAQYKPPSLEISKPPASKAKRRVAKRVRFTRFAAYPVPPERWTAGW